MKINDYITVSEEMVFQHKFNRALPPDVYSVHTHNLYELLYFVEGDATCVIEDRKYKLKAGDLILIRPFLHHFVQIDSTTDYERYDILFDPEKHGIESALSLPKDVTIVNLKENPIAADVFKRCDFYRKNTDDETFFKLLSHMLSELFYNLLAFPEASPALGNIVSPLLSEALHYINENLFTVEGTSELAKQLFVSESYLCRLFQRELHQTPKRYIRDKRLLSAEKMISLGEHPTEVAVKCGFGDYTTFYRNFIAFFGRSPSSR